MALTADFASELYSGQLTKAELKVYDKPGGSEIDAIPFFLNPTTIKITKSVEIEETKVENNASETHWNVTNPVLLDIGELWFDTYESRDNVRATHIEALERLLDYNTDTHHIPCVRLIWGMFMADTATDEKYLFYVEKLMVTYSMFLPDGTPVRAKATVGLKQCLPLKMQLDHDPKQSPDHAKLYTVRRGDTLQGIAHAEYDDPREWRRIADTNRVDDPMNLAPGTKLLVPPILK